MWNNVLPLRQGLLHLLWQSHRYWHFRPHHLIAVKAHWPGAWYSARELSSVCAACHGATQGGRRREISANAHLLRSHLVGSLWPVTPAQMAQPAGAHDWSSPAHTLLCRVTSLSEKGLKRRVVASAFKDCKHQDEARHTVSTFLAVVQDYCVIATAKRYSPHTLLARSFIGDKWTKCFSWVLTWSWTHLRNRKWNKRVYNLLHSGLHSGKTFNLTVFKCTAKLWVCSPILRLLKPWWIDITYHEFSHTAVSTVH